MTAMHVHAVSLAANRSHFLFAGLLLDLSPQNLVEGYLLTNVHSHSS